MPSLQRSLLLQDLQLEILHLLFGSITDSSGTISFGDENLVTTGSLTSGTTYINGDLVVNGSTTTINSTSINVDDPLLLVDFPLVLGAFTNTNQVTVKSTDGVEVGDQINGPTIPMVQPLQLLMIKV